MVFFLQTSRNTQGVWGKNKLATKISFSENIMKRFLLTSILWVLSCPLYLLVPLGVKSWYIDLDFILFVVIDLQ